MNTITVRVLVYEDEQQVGERTISYYAGQDYVVQIVTPDGIDLSLALKAGTGKSEFAERLAELREEILGGEPQ